MVLEIQDDFDPVKIAFSGQCFRVKQFDDGVFRFITGDHVVYLERAGENCFSVSCGGDEWRTIWYDYFDLGRDYKAIYSSENKKHGFVRKAMDCGRGIRILKQDPWEMLVTFIISQRKSIPAIAKAVESLAGTFGRKIKTDREELYTFPAPEELRGASYEDLNACGLGYRTPYVLDAVKRVTEGSLDLKEIAKYSDEALRKELERVYGVGEKVANCIGLFSYGRTACVPVDVWISRAIQDECGGDSPFPLFKENAGIIQQYIFYYERNNQRMKKR